MFADKTLNLDYLIRTLDFGQVTTLIKIGRGKNFVVG
jgi:hypothetical protein|tara:strand:+ start:2088 stop:2198 length:111 start_codon:yes stop_codon:yes gene_type:complete